jgi:hypothetical protein
MSRTHRSLVLQCRGPERRVTLLHLLVAVLIVVGFVGGVGLLQWHMPPLAQSSGETRVP